MNRVAACGPAAQRGRRFRGWPAVPGHEVIAIEIGPGARWKPETRRGRAAARLRLRLRRVGDFLTCRNELVGGRSDGGYAEYLIAHEALGASRRLSDAEAAPLMRHYHTNVLRHPLRAAATRSALGLPASHLAQFASRFGFRTVAIALGQEPARCARRDDYILREGRRASRPAERARSSRPRQRRRHQDMRGAAPGGQICWWLPRRPLSSRRGDDRPGSRSGMAEGRRRGHAQFAPGSASAR